MTDPVMESDGVKVVFVFQKKEEVVETTLNAAHLTALLHAKQVWIEKFSTNLKLENTIRSYGTMGHHCRFM